MKHHKLIYIKEFGFKLFIVQFLILLFNKIHFLKLKEKLKLIKNRMIRNVLILENKDLLNKYQDYLCNSSNNHDKVWIFWWQGLNEAPDIVKACVNSVVENIKDKEIVLISKDNISTYYKIPNYVEARLNNGEMSLAHFSDLLRVSLLQKYGGFWIDATVFCTGNPIKNNNFITVKFHPEKQITIADGKWCIFFMGGENSMLYKFLTEFLEVYWQNHSIVIDYFLTDYAISIAYDFCPFIKRNIDSVKYNNQNIYDLQKMLSKTFDSDEFKRLKEKNDIHKLTYKTTINKENKNNYYNQIVLKCLNKGDNQNEN